MPKTKKKTSTAKTKKAAPKAAKKAPVKKKAKVARKTTVKKTVKKTLVKKTVKKAVKKAAKKGTVKKAEKKAPAKKAVKKASVKPVAKARLTSSDADDKLLFKDFTPYKFKKNENYMNAGQVDHFRNLLNSWKLELLEEVDRTVHHMQDEAANFPDPNDRATQESEFSLELRARDRERKLIKKIDESVTNLSNEEYGYCESCGVEIGIRRLEARPTATLCIDCKTLDEIREKQMG